MKCPMCRGVMQTGRTNMPVEIDNERVVVIRDVPAQVCRQCGEVFISLKTTKKVEKIIAAAKQDGMTLGFVSYSRAA